MNISYQTLKNFVKLVDIAPLEVARAITMSTVEVEDSIDQVKILRGVVVGRVLEIVKHPKADRLWVCRVDVKSEVLQIICGGINLKKDMLVAVATIGARVRWHGEGEPIVLESAKIRGVESHGMIASASEVWLEGLFPQKKASEILDLTPFSLRVGDNLSDALGMTDVIFVVDNKSMSHRPDLWGHYGIARELSCLFKARLSALQFNRIPETSGSIRPLAVTIADRALCPRYSAVVIDNLEPHESPWWLRRVLNAVGYRSYDSVVDVTNYVMMTLGQPLHAFDYAAVSRGNLIVDSAARSFEFKGVTNKNLTVPKGALLIRDASKTIALAGIIGSAASSVSPSTRSILLESANFSPSQVRRISLSCGIRTEASSRFEKGLDSELVPIALGAAVQLLLELHPGSRIASRVVDDHISGKAPASITLTHDFLENRLGANIDQRTVVDSLKRQSFAVNVKKKTYTVTVPSFRSRDVQIREDIVEEVARMYGYEKISGRMPVVELARPARGSMSRFERACKQFLVGSGYDELYTYSFADSEMTEAMNLKKSQVTMRNYISPQQTYLRTSLVPQLAAKVLENFRWFPGMKVFEMGRVFSSAPGEFIADVHGAHLPKQPVMLAGIEAITGDRSDDVYFSVKGCIEKLLAFFNIERAFVESGKAGFSSPAFDILHHNRIIGSFGVLKQSILGDGSSKFSAAWWELDAELLVKYAHYASRYVPLPKFPSVVRDISIIVDAATPWRQIDELARGISPLIIRVELFDVFRSSTIGPEKKSVAFRLTFMSDERTLTTADVDACMKRLEHSLSKNFKAKIR